MKTKMQNPIEKSPAAVNTTSNSNSSNNNTPIASTLDTLPKPFVNSMRTLFNILDDKGTGFVKLNDIEKRWEDDGSKGLPEGVIDSLRKVTPVSGMLSFERFCAGLKISLLRNQINSSRHKKQHHSLPLSHNKLQLQQQQQQQLGTSVQPIRPPSAPILDIENTKSINQWNNMATIRPNNVISHQQQQQQQRALSLPQLSPESELDLHETDSIDMHPSYHNHNQRILNIYGTATSPPPPPKPPRLLIANQQANSTNGSKMDKAEIRHVLQNWQMSILKNELDNNEKQSIYVTANLPGNQQQQMTEAMIQLNGSFNKSITNKRREPRRHTLQNSIDYNLLKRLKQFENERDIYREGLAAVENAKEWYLIQLANVQEKIRNLDRLGSNTIQWSDVHQERLDFQRARILEINRHLSTLSDIPVHMNLALRSNYFDYDHMRMQQQQNTVVDHARLSAQKLQQNRAIETTTVIGVLLGSLALMVVFLLYVNRKWCFKVTKGFACHETSSSRFVHKITRRRTLENTSSDSDEEILRRLRAQNANKFSQLSSTGNGNFNTFNYNGLNNVNVTPRESPYDPLGIAEKGKVGVPSSQSECSSNDSVEASVESNAGILTGERKDRKEFNGSYKQSLDSSSLSSFKETRIDNQSEHKNSTTKITTATKYQRIQSNKAKSSDNASITSVGCDSNNGNNNGKDFIVNVSSELNYDISDLKSLNTESGDNSYKQMSLNISLLYDAPMRKMTVHVMQAENIPFKKNGQQTHTQVRLLMLPNKKQKHKTKIRSGESPQFMESFLLHRVNPEEVNSMGLRVRLYGCERMRKERLIGEAIVSFATIDLELETNLSLPLEPRMKSASIGSSSDILSLARSENTGSTISMQHGGVPELLLGLAYNGITGRLTVEVVKGSHFRSLSLNKAPDTYVKLCLVSSIGQEMARAKTTTRRGQPNPLFKETFVFQVALFQLNDVTLMVSVYTKRNMKRNEMVGWFSLGLNSSGPDQINHWRETARGEVLAKWHVLVDS